MRVLVVDDYRDTADCLAFALRSLGHEVIVAYSEAEAERIIARSLGFDAWVIDWWLTPAPRGSGVELLERLRAGGGDTPAALITACDPEAFESMRLRCERLGRAVCMRKPFDHVELARQLEKMQCRPPTP